MQRRTALLCPGLVLCALSVATGGHLGRSVSKCTEISQGSIVFSDDFEDGDIGDWSVIQGGTGYVALEQYPGPDWSLNIHSPSGTSGTAQATSPTFETAESLDYDVSFEFAFETPIHWIEVFRNKQVNTVIDDCPGDYCTFRCRYGGSNYIIDSLYPYVSYHLDYQVHPGTGKYDVYVGGVFKRTCDFDPSGIPFPQFRIGDFEGGSSNYGVGIYDDFVVTQAPAGTKGTKDIPAAYRLSQNRPNPFEATTAIVFDLPKWGFADLRVYDVVGRLVKTLADGVYPPGSHSVKWEADDDAGTKVRPGVYFIRIETTAFTDTKKMTLLQ
jgi:hypothetical protein